MGAGFIAELSAEENVVLSGAIQGYSRKQILERVDRIMEFAGLEQFRHAPIKYYSSGMMSRLAFATATDLDPEILLVDEVLSAGDVEFVTKAQDRMAELMDAAHILVLVSHQMQAIHRLCRRVVWIDGGRVVADGDPATIIHHFHLHYAKTPEERARDLDATAAMLRQAAAPKNED
jgi:ABC-type polysaccharide/polyol phosphate transport system ATPase subunit